MCPGTIALSATKLWRPDKTRPLYAPALELAYFVVGHGVPAERFFLSTETSASTAAASSNNFNSSRPQQQEEIRVDRKREENERGPSANNFGAIAPGDTQFILQKEYLQQHNVYILL